MEELDAIVDKVASDAAIKGCVIASGKNAFSGGADLSMLQAIGPEAARIGREQGEEAAARFVLDNVSKLNGVLRKLETCGKPFAAAINGVCMGGAFELSLACHFLLEQTVLPSTAGQWLAVLGLGLMPVGAAFYAWDIGVKRGNIQVLGAASYAAPLLSTMILIVTGFAEPSVTVIAACLLITAENADKYTAAFTLSE